MLSVVVVFVPSFFMTGVSRSFCPAVTAGGFSMIASFLLEPAGVPVLSVWWLWTYAGSRSRTARNNDWAGRLRDRLASGCTAWRRGPRDRALWSSPSASRSAGMTLPWDLPAERRRFQLRFRALAGTKFEATEQLETQVLDVIQTSLVVRRTWISLGYVAHNPVPSDQHPSSCGSGVARRRAASRPEAPGANLSRMRLPGGSFRTQLPAEPGDIVSRIMNFGALTLSRSPPWAGLRLPCVRDESARRTGFGIPSLRDPQYGQTSTTRRFRSL